MNSKNITYPNSLYLNIDRQELEKVKRIQTKFTDNNYAFWYICLFSHLICKDVDEDGIFVFESFTPHCYIKAVDIKNVLNVKTYNEATHILNTLKNNYSAIDFRKYEDKVFLEFKISVDFKKTYDVYFKKYINGRETPEYKRLKAINHNNGFFMINKMELFYHFYNRPEYEHGILDFWILLFLNHIINAEKINYYIASELKAIPFCLWGVESNFSKYSILINYNKLARLLNVSERTIKRYIKTLNESEIITTISFKGQGIVILLGHYSAPDLKEPLSDMINHQNGKKSSFKIINHEALKYIA